MIPSSSSSSEPHGKVYAADREDENVFARFWRRIAVQDVFVTVYFTILTLAVVLGITVVVASGFGKMVSFDHVFPTLVDKA